MLQRPARVLDGRHINDKRLVAEEVPEPAEKMRLAVSGGRQQDVNELAGVRDRPPLLRHCFDVGHELV